MSHSNIIGASDHETLGGLPWYRSMTAGELSFTIDSESLNEGDTLNVKVYNRCGVGRHSYLITGINSEDIAEDLSREFYFCTRSHLTFNILADNLTEGTEYLTLTIYNLSYGTHVFVDVTIPINDTSTTPPPTYSLASSASSVNEGSSVTYNLTTTNVSDGTSLNYSLSGISTADISGDSLTGSVTVNNNSASFSIPIVEDSLIEVSETITATLEGQSSSVTINDTSLPTYSISVSSSQVNEGTNAVINLTTTNVKDGDDWSYSISGISEADISGVGLTGNIVIQNNTASFSIPIVADSLTEGNENLSFTINSQLSDSGPILSKSLSITINDTSLTPDPTYTLASSRSSVDEGNSVIFEINTPRVDAGTALPYTITGISEQDINGGALSGSLTISQNGDASISIPILNDSLTEGAETLLFAIRGMTSSVTINDTSTTPVSSNQNNNSNNGSNNSSENSSNNSEGSSSSNSVSSTDNQASSAGSTNIVTSDTESSAEVRLAALPEKAVVSTFQDSTVSPNISQRTEKLSYNGREIEKKVFIPSGNVIEIEVSLDKNRSADDPRVAKVKVSKDVSMTYFNAEQPVTSFDSFVDVIAGSIGKTRALSVESSLSKFSQVSYRHISRHACRF